MTLRDSISRCKALLPLPKLWHRLALPGEPKKLCGSPFREDKHPSFSVFQRDGLWFWRDQARDESGDEIGFLMQQYRELSKDSAIKLYHELAGVHMPQETNKAKKRTLGKLEATFSYFAADGSLRFQIVRYQNAKAVPRQPAKPGQWAGGKRARRDGDGCWWIWNLAGVELVPFNLPAILSALPETKIYIVEGEKCAVALQTAFRAHGRRDVVTTNPLGAGKWRLSYSEPMLGRHCVIVPDHDEAGKAHAQAVAASLYGVAASVLITNWCKLWPERAAQTGKFDIADYLSANPKGQLP